MYYSIQFVQLFQIYPQTNYNVVPEMPIVIQLYYRIIQ